MLAPFVNFNKEIHIMKIIFYDKKLNDIVQFTAHLFVSSLKILEDWL